MNVKIKWDPTKLSTVWALADDEMPMVGRFFLKCGSRWLFVAFLSPEWLGALFLPSLPVAHNVCSHNSCAKRSEVVPYTNYGLHTADFAGILLLQNYSRPHSRRTTDCSASRTGIAATIAGTVRQWCPRFLCAAMGLQQVFGVL